MDAQTYAVAGGFHAVGQGAGRRIVVAGRTESEARHNLEEAIRRSVRLQVLVSTRVHSDFPESC